MKLHFKSFFTAFFLVVLIACSPADDTVEIKVNTAIPVRPLVSLSSKIMDFMSVTINEDCYQQNIRLVVHNADNDQFISSKKVLMRSRFSNPVPAPTPAYTSSNPDIDKVVSQLRFYTYFDEPLTVEVPKSGNYEVGIIGNFMKPVDLNKDGICDAENKSNNGLGNYWTPKANFSARNNHTLSLRLDGSVLAVGGTAGGNISTQLYVPSSNTWINQTSLPETSGDVSQSRSHHTATVLNDGRVLVVGGTVNNTNALGVYNVMVFNTNGSWNILADSAYAERFMHTATKLPDGRVVIIGGKNAAGVSTGTASIFDPSNNSWAPLTTSAQARYSHTATYISTGQILVVGGSMASDVGLVDYQLFTPGSPWPSLATVGLTPTPRLRHTATALKDGRVLIAGGDNQGAEVSAAIIFTPPSTWTDVTMTGGSRSSHQSVLLPDGKVLIFGGNSSATPIGSTVIFNPDGDTFLSLTNVMFQAVTKTASIMFPNGRVFVAGGLNVTPKQETEIHTLDYAGLNSSSLIGHAPVDSNAITSKTLNLRINVLHANPNSNYNTIPTDIASMANNKDFVRFDSFVIPSAGQVAELISVKYLSGFNSPPVKVPTKTSNLFTAATVAQNFYLPHMFPYELVFRYEDSSACYDSNDICGLYAATINGAVNTPLTINLIPSINNNSSAPPSITLSGYTVTTY